MFQPQPVTKIAEIIVPLALKGRLSYIIKDKDLQKAQVGMRVEVPIGKKKITTGIISNIKDFEEDKTYKEIIQFLDDKPIVNALHIKFWTWISDYYMCTIGQVMNAALPANLKINSETIISLSPFYQEDMPGLNNSEFLTTEALKDQGTLAVKELQLILNKTSIAHLIKSLLAKRLIYIKESSKDKYKAKTETYIYWAEGYKNNEQAQELAFELCKRSDRQQRALLFFLENADKESKLPRRKISQLQGLDSSVVNALVKKGIWELKEIVLSRLNPNPIDTISAPMLSADQNRALNEIHEIFKTKNTCLLHGVTGSGKTQLYIELIKEKISKEEQTLYLLPEIALTTQLLERLQRVFGKDVYVYHSKLNNQERVELYRQASSGKGIFVGARSAIFLPFTKLKLIVIDEAHDGSFKQQDPAPRYQGRDAALFLAHLFNAKTLLGTATPSIESYTNALKGKYGLVELQERFGNIELPDIELIDLKKAYKQNRMQQQFSRKMIETIKDCLQREKQVIVFQNRRGYAPRIQCDTCGYHQECKNCDISLTYHKYKNKMICHYCGHTEDPATECPNGKDHSIRVKGFGTEKIEEDLQLIFPSARIGRMDLSSSNTRKAHQRIIKQVENREIDILVGTQMVSKGLDFDNLELVCVVNADQMIQFPDFRSGERAYQLLTQVAGRAGRKEKKGKVLIQTFNPEHPVLQNVITGKYKTMFQREAEERKLFKYPPYNKLIKVQIKHKDPYIVEKAAQYLRQILLNNFKKGILGPSVPPIGRINKLYIREFLIKSSSVGAKLQKEKDFLKASIDWLRKQEGCASIRAILDADMY
jgi:primosomal protein N' (replication factor Y)